MEIASIISAPYAQHVTETNITQAVSHAQRRCQLPSKYHADRKDKNGETHGYASRKEARIAGELAMLQRAGNISELKEQVPFTLLEGSGRVRGIKYIADFTWIDLDTGKYHVGDAKGMRTPVYDLKKKMMFLLLGITVEEL